IEVGIKTVDWANIKGDPVTARSSASVWSELLLVAIWSKKNCGRNMVVIRRWTAKIC
ncbi:hypothetical protein Gotur_013937, partial [Gossypium turneri]